MKTESVLSQWGLRQAENGDLDRLFRSEAPGGTWMDAANGLQVQEVLLREGRIDREVLTGHTESCSWMAEKDWIYRCSFAALPGEGRTLLRFGGVDTAADVFLNGEHLAFHDDQFLPLQLDVTEKLREQNEVYVYFHSPLRVVRERLEALPEAVRGRMDPVSVLRKSSLDFGDFGGVKLTTVGLFEDVALIRADRCLIEWTDVETTFNDRYDRAEIRLRTWVSGEAADVEMRCLLYGPDGQEAVRGAASFSGGAAETLLTVSSPRLWWPKNYGDQPLYRLCVSLYAGDRLLDREEKTLGLRNLQISGDMRFRVNGKEIKLWGGNMVPMDGFTHRWNPQRSAQILALLENSNMNCLRIWGGGCPYGESFFEECDRAGIMIYHDFYLNWAYYPETEAYRRLYRREAEYHVRRLKHHACILLWSGGNETYMHNEENAYEQPDMGYRPFKEDFAAVCRRLDPGRLYLTSSPCGGNYPSDPSEGDGHPLYYTYRHSVEKYPVFVSESARTSTGPLRSLLRFMKEEDIWPEGYVNQVTYPQTEEQRQTYLNATEKFFVPLWKKVPIPQTWAKWSASFFAGESAAVERFYEAHDAESLVYRYNAAYADFMRTYSEGVRRGKPHYDLTGRRRSNGYLLWKINDTWPQFYCSLIDYFLETYIPYYQVRRSFSPVLLSFETDDHILLWGVNDTAEEVRGELTVRGFSMAYNRVMQEMRLPVRLAPGESRVLTDLDEISPILREWAIYACLTREDGSVAARSDTFIELERYLMFPEARLDLSAEGDELVLTTDRFAHCVELTGNEDGDEFGWFFEDNYFNLFPFETKRVRILGRHHRGTVTAKAHYSPFASSVRLEGGTRP